MSRRRRIRTHEILTCYRILNNQEETEEYEHKVPIFPPEINYLGQILKVNSEDEDILRRLDCGMYGHLFIINIKGQSNTLMTVERLVLSQERNNHLCCPVDLATLESLNAKNCPYILAHYGAVLDRSSSELCLYMEPMDITMETFSKIAHSLENLTHIIQWKSLLYRLIHNVSSALNFLTIKGVHDRISSSSKILVNRQGYFKLYDTYISAKYKDISEPTRWPRFEYNLVERVFVERGCHNHPQMWIFGLTLFEILVGENPFRRMTIFAIFLSISKWMPTFPSNLTDFEEIQQLITRLMQHDREQQPQSYAEILEIPFIKDVNEQASQAELDFISRIIDKIPSEDD